MDYGIWQCGFLCFDRVYIKSFDSGVLLLVWTKLTKGIKEQKQKYMKEKFIKLLR